MSRPALARLCSGLVVLLGAVVLLVACSKTETLKLGTTCTTNSDCGSPLACVFGKCHTACREARDCPTGQRCVQGRAPGASDAGPTTADAGVCTLALEDSCAVD
jgi:hypothetical protein